MMSTVAKPMAAPAFAPPGAQCLSLGEIADRNMDLGDGRKRVRVSFRYGRQRATGPLLSIERSECGTAGRLHLARGWRGQHYFFTAEAFNATECWLWTVEDERRAAVRSPNTLSLFNEPIVKPRPSLGWSEHTTTHPPHP